MKYRLILSLLVFLLFQYENFASVAGFSADPCSDVEGAINQCKGPITTDNNQANASVIEDSSGQQPQFPTSQPAPKQQAQVLAENCSEPDAIEGGSTPSEDSKRKLLQGSSLFLKCQSFLSTDAKWSDVAGKRDFARFEPKNAATSFLSEAKEHFNQNLYSLARVKECVARENFYKNNMLNKYLKLAVQRVNDFRDCLAIAAMKLDDMDLTNVEHTSKVEDNSVATSDGKIKCRSSGPETQDFVSCKNFVIAYTSAQLGQKGLEVGQSVVFQNKSTNRQEEMMKSSDNKMKLALQGQRDAIVDQKNMAEANAAFFGAKAGVLHKFYNDIPEKQAVIDACKSKVNNGQSKMDNLVTELNTSLKSIRKNAGLPNVETEDFKNELQKVASLENACQYAIERDDEILRNQEMKMRMKEAFIQAGVDMAGSVGQATVLNKQAGMVEGALNSLNNVSASITIPTFGTASATADYCLGNPADPACVGISSNKNYDFASGGITISGNGYQGTNSSYGLDSSSASSSVGNALGNSGAIPAGSVGSTLGNANNSDGLTNTLGAGRMGESGSNLAGGGGGGGSPGSTSQPNSGDGGAGGGDGAGASGAPKAGATKGLAYSGGGHSTYSGGSGSAAKKNTDNSNPLDGLFNKGQPKVSGDILDFRGVASFADKEKDIFKVISGRYDSINKQKRLMEYESVPKP